MNVEDEHIQCWIKSGDATIVPMEIAQEFAHYLNSLAWSPSGTALDWTGQRCVRLKLGTATYSESLNWLQLTVMKDDPIIAFFFAPNEPCLACDTKFALANLDEAYWKAPGRRYMFGISREMGKFQYHFDHFVEYDGAETLIANIGK